MSYREFLDFIDRFLATSPPIWTLWLTLAFTTLLTLFRFRDYWESRRRLTIRKFEAQQYVVPFEKDDVQKWSYAMLSPQEGDPLELFVVLEFEFTNNYPDSISLGRISIDGWMVDGEYTGYLYDHARDYRVYDLHSKSRTSLANYVRMNPGETVGFRIEAYEHQGSFAGRNDQKNRFRNMRSRMMIDMPRKYPVHVNTSRGKKKFVLKAKRDIRSKYVGFYDVYRISGNELINDPSLLGTAAPQGTKEIWKQIAKSKSIKLRVRRKILHAYQWFISALSGIRRLMTKVLILMRNLTKRIWRLMHR